MTHTEDIELPDGTTKQVLIDDDGTVYSQLCNSFEEAAPLYQAYQAEQDPITQLSV